MKRRAPKRRTRRWRRLKTSMVLGAVVLALVGSALFYVWTRHEVTSWGYQISTATERQSELKQMNRELRLEVASLRSPSRIEAIARDRLGLDFPKPGQIQPLD
jgi:cell division protein FtsL